MERARESSGGRPTRTAIRIVLIDDDASDRARVAAIVGSDVAPVEIEHIQDHVSFFQALKRPDFDLVITEQDLHWSSGKEVLTAIKSLRPSIPVIMVARSEDERIAAEALKEGLDAYIPKSGELAIRLRSSVRTVLQRLEMEVRADTAETRLQGVLDRLNVGVFRAAFDGRIIEANAAFLRLIAAPSLADARRVRLSDLFVDAAVYRGLVTRLEEDGRVRDYQAELRRSDSSTVWVSLTETVQEVGPGDRMVDGLVEDVTLARQAQEALRRANQDYRTVFEITSAATVILEEEGSIFLANSAFERMSGYRRDELEGKLPWAEFVDAADLERVRDELRSLVRDPSVPPKNIRFDFISRDLRTLHVTATLALLPGARRTVVSLLNLTERQKVEEQLLHNAFHDGLTGLPNRLSLLDRMESLFARDRPGAGVGFALLLFGLDRFRVINDCLGHRIGDLLLQAVTSRLERSCQNADTMARCGGDVFGVILSPATDVDQAIDLTETISKVLAEPFRFGDHEVHCTAAYGIALSDQECDANELYRNAEAAMYQAKGGRRARAVVFQSEMFERAWQAFTIESDLRSALSRSEIGVLFQPMADLSSGTVVGFEALLRWRRAGGNLLAPADFLKVAEETGLIVPIGREVLRQACRHLRSWLDIDGMAPEMLITVNLSERELQDRSVVDDVHAALGEYGLTPGNLMLEVPEAVIGRGRRSVLEAVKALGDLGVRLAVDGFGLGLSSLGQLHQLRIDSAKLDRSLLVGIGNHPQRWRVLDGVHALALHLGMRVIVEGIEQRAQLERLLELGCTFGQGRLLSPPVDADAALELLAAPSLFAQTG
jgi:diguanylate cyclase (GGDEF)-like protein/PAS domain S-box-containing protein